MNLRPTVLAFLGLSAALSLAACGKQADLDRPHPLASTGRPSAQQLRRDEAAARARLDGAVNADPQAPNSVDEVRNLGLQTPKEHPVAGSPPQPNPPHPPGVLPDPSSPSTLPQ